MRSNFQTCPLNLTQLYCLGDKTPAILLKNPQTGKVWLSRTWPSLYPNVEWRSRRPYIIRQVQKGETMNYDTEAFKMKLVEETSNSVKCLDLRFNLINFGKAYLKYCHEASMNTRNSHPNSEVVAEESPPPIWDEKDRLQLCNVPVKIY